MTFAISPRIIRTGKTLADVYNELEDHDKEFMDKVGKNYGHKARKNLLKEINEEDRGKSNRFGKNYFKKG